MCFARIHVCHSIFYSSSESEQNIRIRWIPPIYWTTTQALLDNHLGNRYELDRQTWIIQMTTTILWSRNFCFLWRTLTERTYRYVRKPETQEDEFDCARQKVMTFLVGDFFEKQKMTVFFIVACSLCTKQESAQFGSLLWTSFLMSTLSIKDRVNRF